MKKLLKYVALAAGTGLLVAFVAYCGLVGWLQWTISHRYSYNSSPLQGMYTFDTNPLRYKIGLYRFNIPANYTIRYPDILRSDILDIGNSDVISILWPELEPYTEKNHTAFDRRQEIKNKIFFSLVRIKWYIQDGKYDPSKLPEMHDGSLTPEQAFYFDIHKLKQQGLEGTHIHDTKVPMEFIYYPNSKGANERKPTLGNIYAVLDKNHYLYSARCDGAESDHSPWTGQHCESFLKYNDGIYVRYEFDFNLLEHWRLIDLRIRKLIAAFERAAATENHNTVQ